MNTKKSLFDTYHLKADLKKKTIRSGAITIVSQGIKFFLSMVSTVVLARLLSPDDFGIIGMVTAVTGFLTMFKDMGLSMATVQRAKINHSQMSTLFWINLSISFVLMLLIAAIAPFLAKFYGEPRLTWITLALASVFIFGGLTVQHYAMLRRQMYFGKCAIIEIISKFVGIVTAIVSAWYGMRYWALVMMQFATAVTMAIGVWLASGWRPGLPVRYSGVRSMLAFGGNITGFSIVNYFHRNLDKILIGRYYGSFALGIYSKAYQTVMLPIVNLRAPLVNVTIPVLSKLQDEPARFRSYYTKLLLLLSLISMPIMMILFVCSESLILLVYGNQWINMNSLFKVLVIAGFIQPVISTKGLVLISLGQSGRYLRFGIYNSIVVVIAFLIGIQWGALGVAVSYTIVIYLMIFPSLWYCFRFSPVFIGSFFVSIWRSLVSSLVMGIVMFYIYSFMIEHAPIIKTIICSAVGLTVYFLIWILMPEGFKRFRELYGYFLLIFERKKKS